MSELESLLLARRAELVQREASLRAELDALRDARSDSTADDEHDPEGSTLSDDWSRIAGLMDASATENREVDAALLRLLDGMYGRCVSCGRDEYARGCRFGLDAEARLSALKRARTETTAAVACIGRFFRPRLLCSSRYRIPRSPVGSKGRTLLDLLAALDRLSKVRISADLRRRQRADCVVS